MARTPVHEQDDIKIKWESSGLAEHCLQCHGQFNSLDPTKLSREIRYESRNIRESLEIKRLKFDSSKSNINRDDGSLVNP